VHRTDHEWIEASDAIAILTEPSSHYEIAWKYREKPMMLEKPIALNLDQAMILQAACHHVTPCFQLRYDTAFVNFFKKNYGEIDHVEAFINLPRGPEYFESRPWRRGLTPIFHHGIHAVDLFHYHFGPGEVVRADSNTICVNHYNGVLSKVSVDLSVERKDVSYWVNGSRVAELSGLGDFHGLCENFLNSYHLEKRIERSDIRTIEILSAIG
jgi:predicted dehydrogenase